MAVITKDIDCNIYSQSNAHVNSFHIYPLPCDLQEKNSLTSHVYFIKLTQTTNGDEGRDEDDGLIEVLGQVRDDEVRINLLTCVVFF